LSAGNAGQLVPGTRTDAPDDPVPVQRTRRFEEPRPRSETRTTADPARLTRGVQAIDTDVSRRPDRVVPVLRQVRRLGESDATRTFGAAEAGHPRGTRMTAVIRRDAVREVLSDDPASAVTATGVDAPGAVVAVMEPAAIAQIATPTPTARIPPTVMCRPVPRPGLSRVPPDEVAVAAWRPRPGQDRPDAGQDRPDAGEDRPETEKTRTRPILWSLRPYAAGHRGRSAETGPLGHRGRATETGPTLHHRGHLRQAPPRAAGRSGRARITFVSH